MTIDRETTLRGVWETNVEIDEEVKAYGTIEDRRDAHRQVMMAWFTYRTHVLRSKA